MSTIKLILVQLSGKRVGWGLKSLLKILSWVQRVLVKVELFFQPFGTWLFGLRGISFYVARYSWEGFEEADKLFMHVERLLKEAKRVRIALGEMDHALMEFSPLVNGLRDAYEKNQATIEIVNGPGADPETRRIFDFQKQGVVSLFRMLEYKRPHFFLITSLSGQVSIIEEGAHNQAVWMKDESGNWIPFLRSKVRFYYIIERSKRRVLYLEKEYESRKKNADPLSEHPGLSPPQDYSPLRVLADVLLNMPLKHALQPATIFLDLPLDLPLRSLYKINRGDKAHKKVEMRGSEKEPPLIRIEVDSEFDPGSHMVCCGKPATQKQVNYRITLNYETFEVSNVWASVCSECGHKYFAPEVGNTILETIFEIQHPRESQLAALLKEEL